MTITSTTSNYRKIIEYSDKEKKNIKHDSTIFECYLDKFALNDSIIYENQSEAASKALSMFQDRKLLTLMICALTQSGKTGIMLAIIRLFLKHYGIPIGNIYIITGLSSLDWKEQTKQRMPSQIHDRIFHRSQLANEFVKDLHGKSNVLILMDEVQIAACENQSIAKSFSDAGLLDISKLYERDIKIIETTATPDGIINQLLNWDDGASNAFCAEPGGNYTSCFDLLDQGRVVQYLDLCGLDMLTGEIDHEAISKNLNALNQSINKFEDKNGYVIIRTPCNPTSKHQATIDNFKDVLNLHEDQIITYHGLSNVDDINEILSEKPTNTKFIFIKEMLRCSKTLNLVNVLVLYERYSLSINDSVIVQGMLGRGTGYQTNPKLIVFTNIDTIIRYRQLFNSQFRNNSIKWNSNTTKIKRGQVYSKCTFNARKLYYDVNSNDNDSDSEDQPEEIKRKTFEEIIIYCRDVLKPLVLRHYPTRKFRGPGKLKTKNDFCLSTIRGKTRIYTLSEISHEVKQGINDKSIFRLYCGYENLNDPNSGTYVLAHKKL